MTDTASPMGAALTADDLSVAVPADTTTAAQTYQPPKWLNSGHKQTIYAAKWLRLAKVAYWRERWETPDHDTIDLDWVDNAALDIALGETDDTPLVALFHGLEGSSASHYARAFMHAVNANDGRGVVVHFRGCGGMPNRLPRAYHSGDSAEMDWILRRLRATRSGPIFVIGVSVGANVLLKWLGEQGKEADEVITRAAAISAPFDLGACADTLARGFNRFYTRHFLRTMKAHTLAKMRNYQALCDRRRMEAARTLREFDDVVTAPLHGFKGVDDYYARASCGQYLEGIRTRTLIINARNDPFIPSHVLPAREALPASVEFETPEHGGHVGFVSGPFPGNMDWLTQRVLQFFAAAL